MNTIEILTKLEKVNFTAEQARTITEIFEEHHHELATKENVKSIGEDIKYMDAKMVTKDDVKIIRDDVKIIRDDLKYLARKDHVSAIMSKTKYDLVRWIVGAVLVNGLIATLLRFFA